ARHGDMDHLADTEVIVQASLMNCRRMNAVVARSVGMRAQVDRRVQRGQRNAVAALHVAEDFARGRSISGPHLVALTNARADVVDHRFDGHSCSRMTNYLTPDPGELPHLMERVVKRHGCNADDIRLA